MSWISKNFPESSDKFIAVKDYTHISGASYLLYSSIIICIFVLAFVHYCYNLYAMKNINRNIPICNKYIYNKLLCRYNLH